MNEIFNNVRFAYSDMNDKKTVTDSIPIPLALSELPLPLHGRADYASIIPFGFVSTHLKLIS